MLYLFIGAVTKHLLISFKGVAAVNDFTAYCPLFIIVNPGSNRPLLPKIQNINLPGTMV
jgi:hypothetical protein